MGGGKVKRGKDNRRENGGKVQRFVDGAMKDARIPRSWLRSSVGLERRPVTSEVAGSSPVGVAFLFKLAIADKDLTPCQVFVLDGRGFKSRRSRYLRSESSR